MNQIQLERELEAVVGMLKLRKSFVFRKSYSEKVKKSPFQTKVLQELFKITAFPSTATRKDLALILSIPPRSIQVWFQNARQASKKRNVKMNLKQEKTSTSSSEVENEDVPLKRLIGIISSVQKNSS